MRLKFNHILLNLKTAITIRYVLILSITFNIEPGLSQLIIEPPKQIIAENNYKFISDELYLVSSELLNMRSGAGIQYPIIATLSKDETVIVIDKTNKNWWKVNYDDNIGYVSSQMLIKDPYFDWQKKNYPTGKTPDCENITPKYNYELDNYLKINVSYSTDVVIKLMQINNYEDECIRIVYIRGGENYSIKNIPEGKYYLKIAYGKDYRSKIINNECYVKFVKNAQYEKGTQILDYNKIKEPDSKIGNSNYENWSVPSYELLLDVIIGNNKDSRFKKSEISEREFNK